MTKSTSSSSDSQNANVDVEDLDSMRQEIDQLRATALKRMDVLTAHAAEAEEHMQQSVRPKEIESLESLLKDITMEDDTGTPSITNEEDNHKYTPEEVKSVWVHDPPHEDSVDAQAPIVHGAPPEMSQFLSSPSSSSSNKEPSLEHTYWKVQLNIGREPGTWMPKTWGVSGERLLLNLEVQFTPQLLQHDAQLLQSQLSSNSNSNTNNTAANTVRDDFLMGSNDARVCRVVHRELSIAPTMTEGARSIKLKNGAWRIAKGEGPMGTDLLRFFIEVDQGDGDEHGSHENTNDENRGEIRHSGGDVYVPPGKIYCSCGYFVMHRPSGIKDELRDEMTGLEDRAADIDALLEDQNDQSLQSTPPPSLWKRLTLQKERFDLSHRAKKLKRSIIQANVMEPEKSLLRVSRKGDVGLTREGGVCCKVRKGPVAEYHILGRFSLASVDGHPLKYDNDGDGDNDQEKDANNNKKKKNDWE
jgi:hypothetical protein